MRRRDIFAPPKLLIIALLAALFASLAACGAFPGGSEDTGLRETPDTERRNVAMVLLESVRSRSTTLYNEDMKTTPFMDELASESLVAERAYSVVPGTSKSLISIECGVEPPLSGGIPNMLDSGGLPQDCLADLLAEQGYESVFFENASEDFQRRGDLVRAFGYEDFYPLERLEDEGYTEGFQRANYFGYEDDVLLEPSRDWLAENSGEPFLASYETITPHHEYLAPDTYGIKTFAEDDELNRYLNSVRYVDFFLKNLFDQYKELGLYEDTIFVIYADHGEAFGEHGETGHGNVVHEEATRIPLIIHDPRNPGPGRVEAPANHLDLAPTVLDLLGYEPQNVGYTGRSLYSPAEERPLNFACEDDKKCLARIEGDTKLIHHFGESPDELYDLEKDPLEENDLAEDRPREVEEMRSRLLEWRSDNIAAYE